MGFKFLHSSDWHFGAGRRLTPKSLDYLNRHKDVLRRVLKLAMKERVDFILVSGDIFESASTTIEELLAAVEIFTEAGEIAPTIVTAGNHDELSVGKFQTEWLKLLDAGIPNVQFISKPEILKLGTTSGKIAKVSAIPWTGIKNQEEFDQLLGQYAETDIMMLHECFVGVTLDSGMTSKGGVKIPYIPTVKYFAVGDIHKYQRVQYPNAFYSGAPTQFNFGDQLPKGVIIVTVDDEEIYTPKFHPIPQPIELHNITSLDQIPTDSPHWYKLRCDAANMPKHVPANVKVTEPVARKIDLPQPILAEEGETLEEGFQAVDFSEGVAELLMQNGFDKDEITESIEEVQKVASA